MTAGAEWLLANGLGGYALGPRAGPATRGYHGWLVAATAPPDGRVLLVGPIETALLVDGVEHRLAALDIAAGSAAAAGVAVTLEAWMVPGANATMLRWSRRVDQADGDEAGGTRRVALRLTPLLAGRDHHPGGVGANAPETVDRSPGDAAAVVEWPARTGVPPLRLAVVGGTLAAIDRSIEVRYAEEAARGTAIGERLHAPLRVDAELPPGASVTLVIDTAAGSERPLPSPSDADAVALASAERERRLVALAGPAARDPRIAALVLASDRFIVRRRDPRAPDPDAGITVIAGYPWFGDWGRDTMISLPGLTLATGRHEEARRILRTWSALVRDGLLPNHFPETGIPAYHAIDAPLWFVHAIGAWERATGDTALAAELRPTVEAILDAYARGTTFGIGVDAADGLVRGGGPGLQLTWMDAKVAGRVVTPRTGKPVEIQALWIEACRLAAAWATVAGDDDAAARHAGRAARAAASFRERFFRADLGWLCDVVDAGDAHDDGRGMAAPAGRFDDASLRPNQLFALALLDDLVTPSQAATVLDAVERHLVVPGGIRTLAPFEPGYRRWFQGPPTARDAAYHQGAAWTWLNGAWIEAVARWRGLEAARRELDRALSALDPAGCGAIPELLEPEPPHAPRGCPWQAWGVAEITRCAVALAGP